MIGFGLPPGAFDVLCIAAHPDDVEIAAGGTLLELGRRDDVRITVLTMTGTAARVAEATKAAQLFAPGAASVFFDLPDGRLPVHWGDVKHALEEVGGELRPHLILCPSRDDAHQDHRLVAELVTTVWRDALVLEYEIPKWDGDVRSATTYVPISEENARRKVDLLNRSYPSQQTRDWWDEEVFLGRMRMRGMECRHRYAEAFVVRKSVLSLGG